MPYKPKQHDPYPSRAKPKDERISACQRGYDRRWRRLREMKLHDSPVCEADGCMQPANEVDHIQPLTCGGDNSWSNLQSLCKSCHSKKTRTEQNENL